MSAKDWIETGVSILSGAGIGAGLMYLFDPDLGDKRREQARHAAEDTFSTAGDRLSSGWNAVTDKAQEYGHNIADTAGDWTNRAGKAIQGVRSSASDYAEDAADRARSYGRSASNSARGYAKSAGRSASSWIDDQTGPSAGTVAEIALGSVTALALGAGLMYLLDPAQGRRRRAVLRDKAVSTGRQASDYAQGTAQHLSNKAQGWAHEARGMVEDAKEKISSATSQTQTTPNAT